MMKIYGISELQAFAMVRANNKTEQRSADKIFERKINDRFVLRKNIKNNPVSKMRHKIGKLMKSFAKNN